MGAVYEATDTTLGRRVAIKVLRRAFADDPDAVARFAREARAASRVEHPGIVDVLAVGTLDDGRPYLVMSLLRGRSLRDELAARGPLPLAEAWAITRQIALALAAAHDAGVVHRDLKPDNVFLERADDAPARARVLDFGLALLMPTPDAPVDARLTHTGVPMGTPRYMAPEQWWGTDVGPAADQYALAAVFFELATGRAAFSGDRVVELVQRHLHEPPPRLAAHGVAAPAALEDALARALAKTPAERFATLRELVGAVDAALGSGGPPALAVDPHGPHVGRVPVTRVVVEPAALGISRSPLVAAAVTLLASLGALVTAGYSGPPRWDVPEWFRIAGAAAPVSAVLALAAAIAILRRESRTRRAPEPPTSGGVLLALAPAVFGALGTYTGWGRVLARAPTWPETERLTTVDLGLWEAGAARFVGMGLSTCLLAALAASAGARGGGPRLVTVRETTAAAVGVLAVVIAATLGGATSALWVGVVVLCLLVNSAVLPRSSSASGEATRALAVALAAILAAVVGLARVEGRAAILWSAMPTRAARVTEIVATAAEREATLAIAALLLAALGIAEVVRFRRLRATGAPARPSRATIALAALVALGLGADFWLHARVAVTRGALREALSEQFVIFGRLDPPAAQGLSAARFAPHRAPALQVTPAMVAIDAEPVAPLRALESEAGALGLVRDLGQAMARGAVDRAAGSPDLSIAVDRRVPWRALARVFAVAHAAGAREVELLLTVGAAPRIPSRAPPEAAHVLPSDFVALPAELVGEAAGTTPPGDDTPFAAVARGWVRKVRAGGVLRIGGGPDHRQQRNPVE
jgi:serine/threonine-protein kinase